LSEDLGFAVAPQLHGLFNQIGALVRFCLLPELYKLTILLIEVLTPGKSWF
jgi:hypothetical protein